jgi:hypothetical protein
LFPNCARVVALPAFGPNHRTRREPCHIGWHLLQLMRIVHYDFFKSTRVQVTYCAKHLARTFLGLDGKSKRKAQHAVEIS